MSQPPWIATVQDRARAHFARLGVTDVQVITRPEDVPHSLHPDDEPTQLEFRRTLESLATSFTRLNKSSEKEKRAVQTYMDPGTGYLERFSRCARYDFDCEPVVSEQAQTLARAFIHAKSLTEPMTVYRALSMCTLDVSTFNNGEMAASCIAPKFDKYKDQFNKLLNNAVIAEPGPLIASLSAAVAGTQYGDMELPEGRDRQDFYALFMVIHLPVDARVLPPTTTAQASN